MIKIEFNHLELVALCGVIRDKVQTFKDMIKKLSGGKVQQAMWFVRNVLHLNKKQCTDLDLAFFIDGLNSSIRILEGLERKLHEAISRLN